ncbi:hypothetical protein HB364_29220 [Pseudoflavitalea sp. X16]|uniref:SMI1/KNR4 family protein n=1 Tax=Paraflavitalea devenefica TaxID=2716334 RepID=UPI00141F4227|nr:SMI1/KNR4 family protein [Paraflavitalea devenefica]NII29196.1 hypothetical protein [Paraflavitalea devenefica]
MQELIKLHKKEFGGLDHFIELEAPREKLPYGVAVMDPEEDDDPSTITSLGLSHISQEEGSDIELTMYVQGKLSQEAMRETGLLFYTLHGQISADKGFVEGAIYKNLSIPLFGGMQAVMVRNRFYQQASWLDENKQKTKLVLVIPLYTAEAEELEEIPAADRAYFAHNSRLSISDLLRKQDSMVGRAVRNTWANIATWHKDNKSNSATYLADALKATPNSHAGEELEKKLGFKLPVDFKHSFNLIHERVFIGDFDLLPEADILEKMKSLTDMNAAGTFEDALYKIDEDARMKRVWWHEKWVPIGFNSGGDHLILDMSPGPEGIPGQILIHYNDQGPWVKGYHNFLEWLSDYNVDLNRKEYGVSEYGHVLPVDQL